MMIVGFKYRAMTVTGSLHLILGIISVIISITGFSVETWRKYDYRTYFNYDYLAKCFNAGSFIVSLWIIAVGIVGIITGKKSNSEEKTKTMGMIYLIVSILSAIVFSIGGIVTYIFTALFLTNSNPTDFFGLFYAGLAIMIFELTLAIVSSSFCCCCSGIKDNAITTQGPGYLHPSSERNVSPSVCSAPQSMAYPPGATSYPPGATTYPPGATIYPPGATTYPPGATTYPPGATIYPPGVTTYPPGATIYPPGATTCPPGATTDPPNVFGAQMPLQCIAYPPNVAGAQMPPSYNISTPNVAQEAISTPKTS